MVSDLVGFPALSGIVEAGEGNVGFQGQGGQRAAQVVVEVGVAGAVPKGRRLDHFVLKALALIIANTLRSRLGCKTVEVLIYAQDWLRDKDEVVEVVLC
ncbi:hypothetical protein EJ110_NYTH28576 [Nymphaea thermarum]|nr:hypothetical protein EJ110_NYTH28576 [Nymphaea thermarum]